MAGWRGYVFDIELWPQDIYWLLGALILGVLALFIASSVAGRVWCGFACPQTVFTDLFVRVERLFEGDRAARMAFDRIPWSAGKVLRKAAMLDEHSLTVADRGDRRGPKRKSQTWEQRVVAGFGDCINCAQCTQVCPMGIDICRGVNAD